jgi:hypothetical protein
MIRESGDPVIRSRLEEELKIISQKSASGDRLTLA